MAVTDQAQLMVDKLGIAIKEHEDKLPEIKTDDTNGLMKFQLIAQRLQQKVQLTVNVLSNLNECNMSVIRGLKSH
ncbi:hypothetical protein AB751O23_DB_00040 [Chlamydiales bacterium SCGC AB-751-O23]|jgi:hypothetical protein|nr:hypothetical protein AB751O23_DB_00040 [Chlamydiales bacterium SCGC AB-751-O23]